MRGRQPVVSAHARQGARPALLVVLASVAAFWLGRVSVQRNQDGRPDPTTDTARYLREKAIAFSECAPKTGSELRIHLEVEVAPSGTLQDLRVTNLEPLPTTVLECIRRVADRLRPPGFDGVRPEAFGLTVVL